MEFYIDTEKSELSCTITEEKIFCDYGELEFSLDEDVAIVNSISVYLKRHGIGKRLVKEFEILARQNDLKTIEVPASPTKEAILFWKSLGFKPTFDGDKYLVNKIVHSNKESAWNTPQGVIVLTRQV
jgi:N-acetylglutamate synthase-like GNAT family acetyltransferase